MKIYGDIPFDGVWFDKNEPLILCNGGPPLCQVNQTTPNKTNSESLFQALDERRTLGAVNDIDYYNVDK